MGNADELAREIEALRARFSRLPRAGRRIDRNLDFDAVLRSVLDFARSLSRARYGAFTLRDEPGRGEGFLACGLTPVGAARRAEAVRLPRRQVASGQSIAPGAGKTSEEERSRTR